MDEFVYLIGIDGIDAEKRLEIRFLQVRLWATMTISKDRI